MLTENYCDFETAKLLKEKGFDIICDKVYREYDSYLCPIEYCMNLKGEGYYLAPTLQMAMKWLREVHNLFIEITVGESEGKTWYDYDILPINGKFIYWKNLEVLPPTVECNTPEEAIEIGLKYCLEHLI